MRHLAVVLLGGLFSITALPSCSGPEPSTGPDAAAIDGVQACIDAHALAEAMCDVHFSYIEKWCQDGFKNAGPACRDLFSAEWACNLAALQAVPDGGACPKYWPCQDEYYQTSACVAKYGCTLPLGACDDGSINPDGCTCWKYCFDPDVPYVSDCKPNGATWTCDCYIHQDPGPSDLTDPMSLVGTCDEGGPFCDVNIDLSCCNQFFMLSF